ncbi:MAG TPA: DUF4091 domain-containing protein [Candidatus Brocadiia bacterium]|nr:DUF4091 domain-containing protein [Candidatus Brocadiia bacterium]
MRNGVLILSLFCYCGSRDCSAQTRTDDARDNMILNGSFEDGMLNWTTGHDWYAQPPGAGTSQCVIDKEVAKTGVAALRIDGQGKRGLAMQVFPVYPGKFHLEGWIKCEGMGDARAELLAEWIDGNHQWISGSPVGGIGGTTDWTLVSAEIEAPANARYVHIDLIVNVPNSGKAWYDNIAFRDVLPNREPPKNFTFSVVSPEGRSGELLVQWKCDGGSASRHYVYCEAKPFSSVEGLIPRAIAGMDATSTVIGDLENGRECHVAVALLDYPGASKQKIKSAPATPVDRLAPSITDVDFTPVTTSPGLSRAAILKWRGSPVNPEIKRFEIIAADATGGLKVVSTAPGNVFTWAGSGIHKDSVAVGVRAISVSGVVGEPQTVKPVWPELADHVTQSPCAVTGIVNDRDGKPIQGANVIAQRDGTETARTTTDAGGFYLLDGLQRGLITIRISKDGFLAPEDRRVWFEGYGVMLEHRALPAANAPYALWITDPVKNIFRDDQPPPEPVKRIDLLAASNDVECRQVVIRPNRDLKNARIELGRLSAKNASGKPAESLPQDTLEYGFVRHVYVDKNSRATPEEELLRKAPAWFPDEIDQNSRKDLAAGETTSIFLSLKIPKGTKPAVYEGALSFHCDAATEDIPVRIEVAPVELPDDTTLTVVNWLNIGWMGTAYGYAEWSEEHWRMIRHFARMMKAHHQNCVVVPRDLARVFRMSDGKLAADWSRFDRFCELFMQEGVGKLFCLSHWGGRTTGEWECPTFALGAVGVMDLRSRRQTQIEPDEAITLFADHLKNKGWIDRFCTHVADEPIPMNVGSWKEVSARVRKAAPGLRRIDAIHTPEAVAELEILVPQLDYLRQWHDDFKEMQKSGKAELWFYIAWVPQGKFPNRMIDTESVKPRVIHWMSYLFGVTGYLHWALNQWHIRMGNFSPGDEWITWPGESRPNSSLRYEAQREGLEDCELLHMLERANAAVAKSLGIADFDPTQRSREIASEIVQSCTEYSKSFEEISAVRARLLKEIAEAQSGPLFISVADQPAVSPIKPGKITIAGKTREGASLTINGNPVELKNGAFSIAFEVNARSREIVLKGTLGDKTTEIVRRYRIAE